MMRAVLVVPLLAGCADPDIRLCNRTGFDVEKLDSSGDALGDGRWTYELQLIDYARREGIVIAVED
jgi:hypothetical protein